MKKSRAARRALEVQRRGPRFEAQQGIELVGGDTTAGPLNLCITVFGEVPPGQALRRDGARAGDDAVGPVLIRELWSRGLPPGVRCADAGTGTTSAGTPATTMSSAVL